MSKTKQEFQDAFAASISRYPVASQLFQARDPRLLAQLDAMATMLALYSSEQDISAMEPFTKSRDVTVLADASIKGVLPFAKPPRVRLAVQNPSAVALPINAGRRLFDTQGRAYIVDTGATIAASSTGYIEALQQYERVIETSVLASRPFYQIEIPNPDSGRFIASVRVYDAANNEYEYIPEFTNVELEQRAFHIESDESRIMHAVFGATDIAGFQPLAGETLRLVIIDTEGELDIASGSKFAFEYSYSVFEAGAVVSLDSILSAGQNPHDIATLREISKYPAIYDSNAVFLGNFDFLVRRKIPNLRFLSVWNEQIEESVRGADVDNINTLFVAATADGVDQTTLRADIKAVINRADDSYKVSFLNVINSPITVVVTGTVSPVYDFAAVAQQVREKILAEYGADSPFAKRGLGRVLYKRVYEILKQLQAFQGSESDLTITITDPVGDIRPEHYRFISDVSLTVTINQL